ncbi:MAG: aldehyde dehydrogenase family protein [Actinomycetota bacterium]|nr:aldehyde dehydrogenase family protein [Actinomycetota bacterium]
MTAGALRAPEREVVSHDPWTGKVVFATEALDEAAVHEAVGRAERGAERWAATPVAERAEALRRFADLVEAQADELGGLISREVGKLRRDAEGEVAWTALSARWYAGHPPAEGRAGGAVVARRPLGVIAAVTPWNVPLVTPAWKWLPALVAGNAVVWKPSELSTGVAAAAHRLLLEAGVPADVMLLAPGGARTARALCADERVAGLHFTGSEAAGRALQALAAPRFARCALEMSGLNPALVFPDADLDLAADCIVACGAALGGQKCTATRRVLVHEAVRGELVERLVPRLEALRPGPPADPATTLAPLITPAARDGARERVEGSLAAGARVLASSPEGAGPSAFAATLLGDLAPDDPLRHEELFAPVLTLEALPDDDALFAAANATHYGLSAALYTRDPARQDAAAARLRTGVVAVNRRGDDVELEAPFVGVKRSGNGFAEGGDWVYAAVCDLQAVYRS